MKQTLFMIAAEVVATLGVFVGGPFIAVLVYYGFAVLRPEWLWMWALPRGVRWSEVPAAAALIGLVLYAFGIVPLGERKEKPPLGFSATQGFFLVFAIWIGVTYVTAINRDIAWRWFLEYLKIFTMFAIATLVVRTMKQAWVLYLVATVSLLYLSYHVNSLYFFDGRLDIYKRGYAGLDNNGAGLMIAMGIPLALNAFEAERSRWRWLFVLSVPLALHAVLVSYSRGAMVSLIAVVPLLLLRSRRRGPFILVLALLAALIPFLAGAEIRARFATIEDYGNDASANSRMNSWRAAIRIANDNPIFGVGIRNANTLSRQYGADQQGRTIHSQFLQLLADSGYVGLLFYLLTLASFVVSAQRTRRLLRGLNDPEHQRANSMLNGVECSVAVFCVGGLFLSLEVFELPYLLILIGTQVALIGRQGLPAPAGVPERRVAPGFAREPHAIR